MLSRSEQQRRRFLAAGLASGAGLLLPACGGGDADPAAGSGPPEKYVSSSVRAWSLKAAETYNAFAQYPTKVTDVEAFPAWNVEMATVHVAIYDALMAIVGTHEPLIATPQATAPNEPWAQEAAVLGAAYGAIKGLWPDRSALYEPFYKQRLEAMADREAKTQGLALGAEVAAKVLAARANDGRTAPTPSYATGTLPGAYRLPPVPLATPFMPRIKPFALSSADQFRGALRGPLVLTSAEYAANWVETQQLGSKTSTQRTGEQTDTARFHTEPPNLHWTRNLAQFSHFAWDEGGLGESSRTLAEDARLAAMIWVSLADTVIACWDAKYHHWFWRPQSAIALADTDGNADTVADAAWIPLGPVPPHPEYPAAHASLASAIAETLAAYAGYRDVAFTFDSATVTPAVPAQTHADVDEFIESNFMGRIWGGQHFRHSLEDGVTLGARVSQWVREHHFKARLS